VNVAKKDEEDARCKEGGKARRDVMEKLGHAQKEHDDQSKVARHEPNLAVVCEGF
jgi:hypothetical protein